MLRGRGVVVEKMQLKFFSLLYVSFIIHIPGG